MRILLIEDDVEIIRSLSLALRAINFTVATATDGEEGLHLALNNSYDVIILDYNLPKLNGQEVLEKVKDIKPRLPILILTVRSEINDKVALLNSGADDYLTKPFSFSELIARIKSISRRPGVHSKQLLKIDKVILDPRSFTVEVNDKEIKLSTKEFSLLQLLMSNPGQVISRQEIIEKVWDDEADPFSNTVEVHIMRLRKKIKDYKKKLITTCSNRGYKINNTK